MSLTLIRHLWVFLGEQAFEHSCVQILSHLKVILWSLQREKITKSLLLDSRFSSLALEMGRIAFLVIRNEEFFL